MTPGQDDEPRAVRWRRHWQRQGRLARLLWLQAAVLAPVGFLLNWATTVSATAGVIALHAGALFVLGPACILLAHLLIETPLMLRGQMPETGQAREIGLRILCQTLGLMVAAIATALLLEHFRSLQNLLSGPLFSGVGLVLAALVIHTLYEAVRAREIALLRFRSLQAEARFQSLTEQVQPHFLFNALNALAELVHQDPPRAGQGILELAHVYERIHDASQQTAVAFSEDVALVRSYLAIQELRFGSRLAATFVLAPAAARLLVPPFTLLNLVENAIKHGIARSTDGGSVRVSADLEGDAWVLRVTNAPSLPPEAAPTEAGPRRAGAGLANLRSRLALVYGERAALTLTHGVTGTTAMVRIEQGALKEGPP